MLPGAGWGIFSDIFIPKYTWLGEYEGIYLPYDRDLIVSDYAWMVSHLRYL